MIREFDVSLCVFFFFFLSTADVAPVSILSTHTELIFPRRHEQVTAADAKPIYNT